MTRPFLRSLALACTIALAAALGACNPSDIAALQASGVTPTLQEGALTPAAIAASGLPPATQAKLTKGLATIAKVRAVAVRACGIAPVVEGVANIFIAASATASTIQGAARLACRALASAPTYAAFGDRRGERVVGHIPLNGWDVEVVGYRVR